MHALVADKAHDPRFLYISYAVSYLELVSKEFNHLAAILHVYAGGLNFMK